MITLYRHLSSLLRRRYLFSEEITIVLIYSLERMNIWRDVLQFLLSDDLGSEKKPVLFI